MRFESIGVDSLLDGYRAAARQYADAIAAGERRKANRAHARATEIYHELRRRGLEAQRALIPLLNHEDIAVQAWAAGHALEFAPELAEPTLVRIAASEHTPLGLMVESLLRLWRDGDLPPP